MTARDTYEEDRPHGRRQQNKDLVLAPGEYAYVQELTKGTIQVLVGPTTFSPTAQHTPVIYVMKGNKSFEAVDNIENAVQKSAIAVEGMYLQLLNPAKGGVRPPSGHSATTPELQVGRKVNIPGPVMFPLWPGQSSELLRGHTLRSNQYLLVKVYNDEEARENWAKAVVKPAEGEGDSAKAAVVASGAPDDLSLGKHYLVRGTEVSFYIPPTGVSVVPDLDGNYVREALTLERLEYCILVNEGGDKRYERGPAVVFPEPNETFITSPKNARKFRAIELNDIQGIYIKVIADYAEKDGTQRKAGDELFITGKDIAIYFPREEHSLIKYDKKAKHFATAIPAGEGRYVMDRTTGTIRVARGPAMELPDPRNQVFVVRRLTERECNLWYPGNTEALEYNKLLTKLESAVSATRGAISEGQVKKSLSTKTRTTKGTFASTKNLAGSGLEVDNAFFADSALIGSSAQSFMPDEFTRGSTYTNPRTVTLNTKYQGAPVVIPFTGYAVQVVAANDTRRVVEGPARLLMGYDETLEVLTLSSGKPKTTDDVKKTVYLRTKNNKISDVITVETKDHVKVSFRVSFLADFTGDNSKWFEVENYVKLLCDHVRSMLAGAAKRLTVAQLYADAIDFVRDNVLGKKTAEGRTGLLFEECGLLVRDVEVLHVAIQDQTIAKLLDQEQHAVVSENIRLDRERRNLEFTREHEDIQRKIKEEAFETAKATHALETEKCALDLALTIVRIENEAKMLAEKAKSFEAGAAADQVRSDAVLAREKAVADQKLAIEHEQVKLRISEMMAEAEALLKQTEHVTPQLTAALTTLSNNDTLERIAQACSVQQLVGGKDAVQVITSVFKGIPGFEAFMKGRGLDMMLKNTTKGKNGSTKSAS